MSFPIVNYYGQVMLACNLELPTQNLLLHIPRREVIVVIQTNLAYSDNLRMPKQLFDLLKAGFVSFPRFVGVYAAAAYKNVFSKSNLLLGSTSTPGHTHSELPWEADGTSCIVQSTVVIVGMCIEVFHHLYSTFIALSHFAAWLGIVGGEYYNRIIADISC